MLLSIDSRSPVPPYEQLRAQLAVMVADRVLEAGTRLPPIRALAGDLDLAPNTVARAYRELEEAGVVETRGRHGTFVLRPRALRQSAQAQDARLAEAAVAFAREVRLVGANHAAAMNHVRKALGST